MKSMLLRSVLPVLVVALAAACSKKDGGGGPKNQNLRAQAPQEKPEKEESKTLPKLPADPKAKPEQSEPKGEGDAVTDPELPGGSQSQGQKPGQTPAVPTTQEKPQATPQAQDKKDQAPQTTATPPENPEDPKMPGEATKPKAPAQQQGETQTPVQGENPQTQSIPVQRLPIASKYSGAGNDGYREYLIERMNSVQEEAIRARNLQEAERIRSVKVAVDRETGDVMVTVKRREKGKNQQMSLVGALDRDGFATLTTNGSSAVAVRGWLMCLDRNDRTCFTTHVRLEVGQPGSRAIVNAISRKTNANFDFSVPSTTSGNREMAQLIDLFENTSRRIGTGNALRSIFIETSEVILGRSAIRIGILSNEREAISAVGPLLAPENDGVLTNVRLGRDTDLADLSVIANGEKLRSGLQSSISEMRLIGNDSKREFTIAMTVKSASNGESLRVTLLRQHQGIKSIGAIQNIQEAKKSQSK